MLNNIDIDYCSSSFLMYRTVIDKNKKFSENLNYYTAKIQSDRIKVKNSEDLYNALKKQIESIDKNKKIGLALSGGIDSAILAKLCPKNTIAYTFKCVVPGVEVLDETQKAKEYAELSGLEHKIVKIFWEDFEIYSPILMKHKGAPIHSIEVQIYKAALQAKKDGCDILIFGESADCLYGGFSNVLSKDWHYSEFIDRYSFVLPYKVLNNPVLELAPFKEYMKDNGMIDVHKFYSNVFFEESINSYYNACSTAGIECCLPYSNTILNVPLDINKVRSGKNKYLVREIFEKLYKDLDVPAKIPMPRPMNEWMENYTGPSNKDIFIPNCALGMTGDQKWYIYSLSIFIDKVLKEF